jgi:hypothetical protein
MKATMTQVGNHTKLDQWVTVTIHNLSKWRLKIWMLTTNHSFQRILRWCQSQWLKQCPDQSLRWCTSLCLLWCQCIWCQLYQLCNRRSRSSPNSQSLSWFPRTVRLQISTSSIHPSEKIRSMVMHNTIPLMIQSNRRNKKSQQNKRRLN